MGESDRKMAFQYLPSQAAHAAFPFARVRRNSEDRPESHLVELTLLGHALDAESERIILLDSFYTEIEPSSIVTNCCIGHSISGKPTVKEL